MLQRALEAGVPASWVTADEAYGGDPALRRFLADRGLSYVLAVKGTEPLGTATQGSTTACRLAARVPAEQWVACSAGHGAKGRRLYDWARVGLAAPAAPGTARWLLVRRSRRDGGLAFYACCGPASTSLIGLVRVAGVRWAIEECFQAAKGQIGLDHYQVRRWPGWYRHVTLALLAHAFLVVTRTKATTSSDPTKGDAAA
jgi:SRSO17 transposase